MATGGRFEWGLGASIPFLAVGFGIHVVQSAWIAILLYHGIAIVFLTRSPARIRSLRMTNPRRRVGIWLLAIASGLTAGPLLLLFWDRLELGPPVAEYCGRLGLSGISWTLFAIYHVLINPLIEELLWRDRLGSPSRGLTFSDLLFAGYHALAIGTVLPVWTTAIAVVSIAAGAWFWRQIVRETGSLAAAMAAHLAADAAVMVTVAVLAF